MEPLLMHGDASELRDRKTAAPVESFASTSESS